MLLLALINANDLLCWWRQRQWRVCHLLVMEQSKWHKRSGPSGILSWSPSTAAYHLRALFMQMMMMMMMMLSQNDWADYDRESRRRRGGRVARGGGREGWPERDPRRGGASIPCMQCVFHHLQLLEEREYGAVTPWRSVSFMSYLSKWRRASSTQSWSLIIAAGFLFQICFLSTVFSPIHTHPNLWRAALQLIDGGLTRRTKWTSIRSGMKLLNLMLGISQS